MPTEPAEDYCPFKNLREDPICRSRLTEPWSPENETDRSKNIECVLDHFLGTHRALLAAAKYERPDYRREIVATELCLAAYVYRRLKAYAEYLTPGAVIDLDLSESTEPVAIPSGPEMPLDTVAQPTQAERDQILTASLRTASLMDMVKETLEKALAVHRAADSAMLIWRKHHLQQLIHAELNHVITIRSLLETIARDIPVLDFRPPF